MSDAQRPADVRRLLADALLQIKELRKDSAEAARREPIAVVGMACRFPGAADSPKAFWNLLEQGIDTVTEVPPERWDHAAFYDARVGVPGKTHIRWGSFIEGCDRFDPLFFNISPREAAAMDPQQRILLEVAVHAMEDACLTRQQAASGSTGVFVGVCNSDYYQLLLEDVTRADAYSGTGILNCVLTGRLSYSLDLRGPSVPVDTGCSASLVAVHLACQSLRNRESDVALAGGVNLILSPRSNVVVARLQALSPDGRCRAFDAAANGIVRGEGCGVVVLKRMSDALADGDRILAVLRGSAVNQDGRSTGLTAPNVLSQQAVIRAALANAGLSPHQVSYVETHGTGTPLGDPIEFDALKATYGASHPERGRCVLGAVKTNIGHLESAAGIAGLIKVILSLQHDCIPRNLHLQDVNPRLGAAGSALELPRDNVPWPRAEGRFAAVSSFGIGGTNAHVILGDAPPRAARASQGERAELLAISARSRAGLAARIRDFREYLSVLPASGAELADVAFTSRERSDHHEFRVCVAGRSAAELSERLELLELEDRGNSAPEAAPRRVAFVFSGQGSQWPGMARVLLKESRVFRESMQRCDAGVRALVGWSPLEELAREAEHASGDADVIQPLLFSIQVSLVAVLREYGVVPDAAVGQSMGEVAAAHAIGALSLDDALRVICLRSRVIQKLKGRGGMFMAELSLAEARAAIVGLERSIAVATNLAPRAVTFSGETATIARVREQLERQGHVCRTIKADTPTHCPLVDDIRDELLEVLAGVRPVAGRVPLYSAVTRSRMDGSECDARYWELNLKGMVALSDVVELMIRDGIDVFVELSPHAILRPSIEQTAQHAGAAVHCLPVLRKNADDSVSLLESLGALHALGVPVRWQAERERGVPVPLPPTSFQRERYWLPKPSRRSQTSAATAAGGHAVLPAPVALSCEPPMYVWQFDLDLDAAPYLADHRVLGALVVPGAAHLDFVVSAARGVLGPVTVDEVHFAHVLTLPEQEAKTLQLVITMDGEASASFHLASRVGGDAQRASWMRHSYGKLRLDAAQPPQTIALEAVRARCPVQLSAADYYRITRSLGIDLGPRFQGIARLVTSQNEALAELQLSPEVSAELDAYAIHPALLDICFQAIGGPLGQAQVRVNAGDTYLPVGVESLRLLGTARAGQRLFSYALMRPSAPGADGYSADLSLLNEAGEVLLEARGLMVRRVGREATRGRQAAIDEMLLAPTWTELPAVAAVASAASGARLVFAQPGTWGVELARELTAAGGRCSWSSFADGGELDEIVATIRTAAAQPGGCSDVLLAQGDHTQQASHEALEHVARGVEQALTLVQAIAQAGLREVPRLWFVSRVSDTDGGFGAVAAAPLSGLARTLRHEHPELVCTTVEFGCAREDWAALVAELRSPSPETELRLFSGRRLAARLERAPALPLSTPRLSADGCYLVTGGLTGLGFEVARSLAERGARHLVLVARRPPSDAVTAALQELAERGVDIIVEGCDVAVEADVIRVLDGIAARGLRLRGVVHSAAVIEDATALRTTREALRRVLAPKVSGALNLDRHTERLDLDFFVLFSSVASLLGSPGQCGYAAASAFIDALAHQRRARGLPAMTINWGPWAEIGLAAAAQNRGARVAARGVGSIDVELGFDVFFRLLAMPRTQLGVVALDLRQWTEFYPGAADSPLLANLVVGSAPAVDPGAEALRETLLRAGASERVTLLEKHLREELGRVLRLAPSRIERNKPFNSFGVDSLTGLEIRNRLERSLGLTLPAILLYAHPTAAELSRELAKRLEPTGEEEAPQPAEPARENVASAAPDIAALSEEDAEALLARKLAELNL